MPRPDLFLIGEVPVQYDMVRMALATYLLGQMIDTPTHGYQGQASKEVKVKAAFDYADLLLKG